MNYAILKAWSQQNNALKAQLEAVCLQGQELALVFKDGRELRFVLSSGDAFCLLTDSPGVSGAQIWQQLRHSRIEKLWLDPSDRILYIELNQTDIYQQQRWWRMIAELSPPRPNVILCELEGSRPIVVDALHKYSLADNPARQILPRLEYQAPQTGWKPPSDEAPAPYILKLPGGDTLSFDDANSYLSAYYTQVLKAGEASRRRQQQLSHWQKAISKLRKKLAKQRDELKNAEAMDTWKLYAEIIKYNLGRISKGQKSLEAVNYYDPAMPNIEIPLREELSPSRNLELYLKRYKKAKTGLEVIACHIEEGEAELQRLSDILERIESGEDLDFISAEGKAAKHAPAKLNLLDKLLKVRINEDFEIVIGRKASENDFVSTQLGRPHDWWFHTRVFRGAHVLLRCLRKTNPPPEIMTLCCRLAAWFSKARFSSNVPVDYTQVRFLRKPRRSAPGFVTYTDHQTAFVEPLDPRAAREELGL